MAKHGVISRPPRRVRFNDVALVQSFRKGSKATEISRSRTAIPTSTRPTRDQRRKIPHICITAKDAVRLRRVGANLATMQKRADGGFVLDSGASATLVKKRSWIGRLVQRLRVCVRDAVGNKHSSTGTGMLNVRVKRADGTFYELPNAGTGTVLSSLMYNLMSVSQLCSNGFTVVFKDKRSRIVSPSGDVIPLVESG